MKPEARVRGFHSRAPALADIELSLLLAAASRYRIAPSGTDHKVLNYQEIMPRRRTTHWETLVDLIIPIGAVLLICFSLGSIWFDGGFHVSARAPHQGAKASRTGAMADIP
jgi:hypothetical protein